MALSGLFLIIFLVTHLVINSFTLAPSKELFNEAAHFMATNPIIYVMQYVLALGFIIHIAMGIKLTIQNKRARSKNYVYKYRNKPGSFIGTPFNTAGWTSVEVAAKIIEKIGPILATKY